MARASPRGAADAKLSAHGDRRRRHLRPHRRPARVPRRDPPDRRRARGAAGRRDRRQGRVPVGHPQAVRRARPARPAVRRRVRRHRHRHADAQPRGRGGRARVRVERADPDDPGARHAADPAVRHRGAQAALPAALRERRVVAGLRAVRARGRLRSRRHDHPRRARRRRVGDHRHQELDHQPRRRRLLRRVRQDRPGRRPLARHQRVRGRGRPARASPSASSSTSSASRARRPASRSSTTSACRPGT